MGQSLPSSRPWIHYRAGPATQVSHFATAAGHFAVHGFMGHRKRVTCKNARRHLIASSRSTISWFPSFQKYDANRFKSSAFATPAEHVSHETRKCAASTRPTCGAQHGGGLDVCGCAVVSCCLLNQPLHLKRAPSEPSHHITTRLQ